MDNKRLVKATAAALLCAAAVVGLSLKTKLFSKGVVPSQRRVAFRYSFKLIGVPRDAGKTFVWVPVPLSSGRQELESFTVEGDWPYEIVVGKEYGNRFLRLDLSNANFDDNGTLELTINYRLIRRSVIGGDKYGESGKGGVDLQRLLESDALVPIDGKIAAEAKRIAGSAVGNVRLARLLYDNIVMSVKYDKRGKGWGRGDAAYACDIRSGNCTDFHSLFIGEARSLGIPARFVMGYPLLDEKEGVVTGYHCWAEFKTPDGWMPIDASEASKHPELRDAFFGGLDPNRIAFTIGRDIILPGAETGMRNYLIYPHVEIDGRVHSDVKMNVSFKEI